MNLKNWSLIVLFKNLVIPCLMNLAIPTQVSIKKWALNHINNLFKPPPSRHNHPLMSFQKLDPTSSLNKLKIK
jgi:hypothetical protein